MDKSGGYATLEEKGIRWIIERSFYPLIPEVVLGMLLAAIPAEGSRIIRENRVRRSMLIRSPRLREAIFAKLYKKPTGADKLKYFLFSSKASAEWRTMCAFFARGLPVARPLACGVRRRRGFVEEAYLFTQALNDAIPLTDYASRVASFDDKQALSAMTAKMVAELHTKGFFFRDLHAGNVLIVPQNTTAWRIFLTDFHKVWHTRWVPRWMRARDLAQLHNSLVISRTDRWRFLKRYLHEAQLPAYDAKTFARQIDRAAAKMWDIHLKSRTKRCLVQSTEFAIYRRGSYKVYRHRMCPEALFEKLFNMYDHADGDNRLILKKTPKQTVSLLSVIYGGNEYKVVVKESLFKSTLGGIRYSFFPSRPRRNWIGARALQVRGIPTPDALALIEWRCGLVLRRALLFTRYIDHAYELNEYVLTRYSGRLSSEAIRHKRRFIGELARLIRSMHERGIYHADLKSNNILVREEKDAWKLFIVDLDRIRCKHRLSFEERANNLAQINASVAACITAADRALFFKQYAYGSGLAQEAKKYYRRIIEISRQKNSGPYGLIFKQS